MGKPAGSKSVFAVRPFRMLWSAGLASIVGDQLARVALSLLVFERTGSAAATAGTYALTMVPALVSGVLLAGLADRYPRRTVMISADLVRAVLVAVMAVPGMPLYLVAGLLVLVQLAEGPFSAAQGAVLPEVLGGRYEAGQAVSLITHQSCQIAGFALGGLIVAGVGPHWALAIDAVTFLVSAALVRLGIERYPVAATAEIAGQRLARWWGQIRDGALLVAADRRLRVLLWLGWLALFTAVPEGLAVVYAAESGLGAGWVGVVLAAEPVGAVAGALLLRRLPRRARLGLLGWLAVGTSVPLVFFALDPALPVALALLVVSGAFSAYQITAGATFVQLCPDHQRGQALGLARAGLVAGQGFGIAGGGVLAQGFGSATTAIAVAGAAGALVAIAAASAWSRLPPRQVSAALPAES